MINPRRADCKSPFERLAGVGVAYRLAQAVLRAVAQQSWSLLDGDAAAALEEELLDLVAIGTVADMMPLQGENRSLVRRGLAQLNQTTRPGLELLMQKAGVTKGGVDAASISFRIAPRINAAGRMAHAKLAYELLRTADVTKAYSVAERLEALNLERRTLTQAAEAQAETQLAPQLANDECILIVQGPDFPSGIVGLVAGKLTDRYYRPRWSLSRASTSRGQCTQYPGAGYQRRAGPGKRVLLVRHGGHQSAAGFTVETARLDEFSAALRRVAAAALDAHDDLRPSLTIDATAPLDELNWGLVEQFSRLEPTGQGNRPPLLLTPAVRVRDLRSVGAGKHLKLVLDGGPGTPVMDAIGFGLGDYARELTADAVIDVVGELNVNEWNGRRQLQLMVQDLRVTGSDE